jgi:phosphoenolpyruvate-protein phosphotransferase (PTS system enzyme I)
MKRCLEKLQGFPVSFGQKEGKLFFLPDEEIFFQEHFIAQHREKHEIDRFHKALKASKNDLESIHEHLKNKGHDDAASIIDAHIQMLQDPFIQEAVVEGVKTTKRNVESVFKSVVKGIEKNLCDQKKMLFEERFLDVEDLSGRVLRHLVKLNHLPLESIPKGSILVVKKLSPSFVAALDPRHIHGIISEFGGLGCHAALIARSKGIPYITKIPLKEMEALNHYPYVMIDGTLGTVTFSYEPILLEEERCELSHDMHDDSHHLNVSTWLNISQVSDLSENIPSHVSGVGLCRSEYLILENRSLLYSEVLQTQTYLKIASHLDNKPLVVRAFDVGGDKTPADFLGIQCNSKDRGIRFLMQRPDLLMTQLKAVMSVKKSCDVKFLIPFVSSAHEIDYIMTLMNKIHDEEPDLYEKVPLGAMIELPAAVYALDQLCQRCAFFSLGTNDLLQFFLGQDRKDMLFDSAKSSVAFFRMIKDIVKICHVHKKPLTLCGEMALDADLVHLLHGIGVTQFSLPLPQLEHFMKSIHRKKMSSKQVKRCLEAVSPDEFLEVLKRESRQPLS